VRSRRGREQRLLALLQGRIAGCRIPAPRYYLARSAHFPFGLAGYPKIEGAVLRPQVLTAASRSRLAAEMAHFIYQLQALPLAEVEALQLARFPPPAPQLHALWRRVSPYLRAAFTAGEHAALVAWWQDSFAEWTRRPQRRVLAHGDLWYENILVTPDGRHIAGVLDFEDAVLGLPLTDFVTQLYLGESFTAEVIAAFQERGGGLDDNGDMMARLRRLLGLRELLGLARGIESGAPDADASGKIRATIL
jgi:aminoglycoside phosphotransferase (APT) family kinase protein